MIKRFYRNLSDLLDKRLTEVRPNLTISPMMPIMLIITKTCPCNKQRFFSASKIEIFIGFFVDNFNMFAQNIDCGYTLELPCRGGSNELPQSMVWS